VELAVEAINRRGGVGGRKLELIVEDDKNSLNGALEADKRLIERGVAAIIGHMTSSQTLGVLPIMEKARVPLISPTSSSSLLSNSDDVLFQLNQTSKRNVTMMARYVSQNMGVSKVGIVYDIQNQAFSAPYSYDFAASFRGTGGEVPFFYLYSPEEGFNWNEFVSLVEDHQVEAILFVTSAADTAAFAQDIRAHQMELHLLSSGWAFTNKLLQYGGGAIEGMLFADSFNIDSESDRLQEFKREYHDRYGAQANFAAVQAYESVLLLVEGLRRRKQHDGDLLAALRSVRCIEGVSGELCFNEYGEVIRPCSIIQVKNGSFQTVATMSEKK